MNGQQLKSVTVGIIKKFPSRYVYSTRCNPNVVEMLLKKVKTKSHFISQSKVYQEKAVPVDKNECTEITAKVHVNRGVDSRSYAQVVRESGRKSVTQISNMVDQGIGVNHVTSTNHVGKQLCQDGVKYSDVNVAPPESVKQQSKYSQVTSPASKQMSKDRGIVIIHNEASYTPSGTSDSVIHIEALNSHSSSRLPTIFTNSLGQTQATANMGDLAEPLTSTAKGQKIVAPVHSKVVRPKSGQGFRCRFSFKYF